LAVKGGVALTSGSAAVRRQNMSHTMINKTIMMRNTPHVLALDGWWDRVTCYSLFSPTGDILSERKHDCQQVKV
jgi:hypothetical protein